MESRKSLQWKEMLQVPPEKLNEYSLTPIRIFEESDAMFRYLARFIADLIKQSNNNGKTLKIGWPVGPKKHLLYLVRIINLLV